MESILKVQNPSDLCLVLNLLVGEICQEKNMGCSVFRGEEHQKGGADTSQNSHLTFKVTRKGQNLPKVKGKKERK